jgi:hypothetical protein
MTDDEIIAEISMELGSRHGPGHMDPNSVCCALWDWAETTPETPHNSVIWNEVKFLLSGYSAPDVHERRYAALAGCWPLEVVDGTRACTHPTAKCSHRCAAQRPLLGVKRTRRGLVSMSANDPKRT